MPRDEAKLWDGFAGIYDAFMKKDLPAYREMIGRIGQRFRPDSRVLEIATGTGILSLGIADSAGSIESVDLSPEMISAAQEKARRLNITNVRFSVADATALPYGAERFDIVIIANTLHIMPEPERALKEIGRVLKTDGLMIAPTFVHAQNKMAGIRSRLMSLTGFRAYHKWAHQSYVRFLAENGFDVVEEAALNASFPLVYAVARKTGQV